MHCECWIPVHCDATKEWERNRKFRYRPGYLKALWRNRESNQMRALVAGDINDDLKRRYGSYNCSLCEPWWSWWDFATGYQRIAFDILQNVIISIRWHLTFRNCYVTFQPQFTLSKCCAREQISPLSPGCATVPKADSYVCFNLCIQPNVLKSNQATKAVILKYT